VPAAVSSRCKKFPGPERTKIEIASAGANFPLRAGEILPPAMVKRIVDSCTSDLLPSPSSASIGVAACDGVHWLVARCGNYRRKRGGGLDCAPAQARMARAGGWLGDFLRWRIVIMYVSRVCYGVMVKLMLKGDGSQPLRETTVPATVIAEKEAPMEKGRPARDVGASGMTAAPPDSDGVDVAKCPPPGRCSTTIHRVASRSSTP